MCSILVIDDEKGILRVLDEALTRSGYQVEIAEDGFEGIQKFDGGGFDIVITDIRMPKLDGESVAKHIRKSPHKSIPVIGMSGTPWLVKESCFDVVFPKPFNLRELIDSVSRLLAVPSPAAASA
jgi:CheY-like chemotaxis protein